MSTSGGATWKELEKSMDDGYAIAVGPTLYQAGCDIDRQSSSRAMAIRKSSDGKTWQEVMLSKEYGFVRAIAIHPRDPQVLLAGGQCVANRSMASRLYRSTDAGSTWSEIPELTGKGSCVNGIAIDPAQPSRILVALDTGVFVSEDNGKTWIAPVQAIPATCILADAGTKERFFVGSSQGVWITVDGGKSWREINENIPSRSIACVAFDQKNSVLFAGGASGGVMRMKLAGVGVSVGTR